MAVFMCVVVIVATAVIVVMVVSQGGQTQEPLPQDGQTEHGDEEAGG